MQARFPLGHSLQSPMTNSPTPHSVAEAVRQLTPCLRGHPIGRLRMLTNVPEFLSLLSYSSA